MQHIPLMICLSRMCPLLIHIIPQGEQYSYISVWGVSPVKDGLITPYDHFLETDDLDVKKLKATVNIWYKAGKKLAALPSKSSWSFPFPAERANPLWFMFFPLQFSPRA